MGAFGESSETVTGWPRFQNWALELQDTGAMWKVSLYLLTCDVP